MKHLCRALAAAGAILASLGVAAPALADNALQGKVIVVDPGHGGRDTGAIKNGLLEKNVTLAIGLDLRDYLQGQGARVVMTRQTDVALGPTTDTDLQARVNIARRAHADAFIAVHGNSVADPGYSGATTYYGPGCGYYSGAHLSAADVGRGFSLARLVQAALVNQTHEINRGSHAQIYWVLGDPGIPSILVETGFLSNQVEAAKLANPAYQHVVASAIGEGVDGYFSSGDAARTPWFPAANMAGCPPAPAPVTATVDTTRWVQTYLPAALMSGADPKSQQFTVLPPFSFLKVLARKASYFLVMNPTTNGPGYVDAGHVGPSGPPPVFRPFWVENFAPTGIWSGPNAAAARFAFVGRWNHFLVVKPQEGPRLLVRVAATGNVAYVDASAVGPSGPPR
ncbi:MAG: N-acetylmuramoyl-L-alanine amidase family protein [Chloroflexota bacterium]